MADIKDLKKELGDITNLLNTIASEANRKVAEGLKKSAQHTGDLSHHLQDILKNFSDLPKRVKTVSDLEKKMATSAKWYHKVKEQILKTHKQEIEVYWKKVEKFAAQQTNDINEQIKIENQFRGAIQKSTEALNKQLDALAPRTFSEKMKAIGAIITGYLVKQVEKFKEGLKAFPKALIKSFREAFKAKSVEGAVEAISKPIDDLLDSIPVVGGALKFLFQTFRRGFFAIWDHIEKRVLPTNIELIKQFGSLSGGAKKLGSAALSMGMRFESMGYATGEGMKAVVGFGAALKTVNLKQFGENAKGLVANLGVRLQKVLGLSAEQAGNLGIAFENSGVGLRTLNPAMDDAALAAKELGVPINQVRKDMGANIGIMQRFGVTNRMEFNKGSALARAYGSSIDKVTASFGGQLDTFEGTSSAAAKLNAIFGTHINSYELMLETDPTKRMVMLGKELQKQGKNWDNLNVFEKNVLKTTLKLNDEQAAQYFGQKNIGKSYKELSKIMDKQDKKKKAELKANETWKNQLRGLTKTLFNFKFEIERIVLALANLVAKFLGLPNAAKGVFKTADGLKDVFKTVREAIEKFDVDKFKENVRDFMKPFTNLIETIKDVSSSALAMQDTFDTIFSPVMSSKASDFAETFISGGKLMREDNKKFLEQLDKMSPEMEAMFERKLRIAGVSPGEARKKRAKIVGGTKTFKKEEISTETVDLIARRKQEVAERKRGGGAASSTPTFNLIVDGKELSKALTVTQVETSRR